MNRLPRLPLTVFEHPYARGHQSLASDQLEYVDVAADSQRRSYALVCEQHALNVARVERPNSALSLSDGLRQLPIYAIGVWVWTYNTAATIRQGVKAGTDFKVLKAKLSLNWTGPFKVLAVGPSPAEATPDGRPLASKLLYLDLPNDMPGAYAPLPRRRGRRYRPNRTSRGRENHQPPVGTWPGRCRRHPLRDSLEGPPPTIEGARDEPPTFPTAHPPVLGRHTTSTPTDESVVPSHARRCCPTRTLTRSGRPVFVPRLQPRHAPRLDTSLQQHNPSRRRPLLVQGTRSSLVARQNLLSHHDLGNLPRTLLGRP